MTHFWEPLSDDDGLELFGSLWRLDGEVHRLNRFLRRVGELAVTTWPSALGALAAAIERTDSDEVQRRCYVEAARIAVWWEEPAVARTSTH